MPGLKFFSKKTSPYQDTIGYKIYQTLSDEISRLQIEKSQNSPKNNLSSHDQTINPLYTNNQSSETKSDILTDNIKLLKFKKSILVLFFKDYRDLYVEPTEMARHSKYIWEYDSMIRDATEFLKENTNYSDYIEKWLADVRPINPNSGMSFSYGGSKKSIRKNRKQTQNKKTKKSRK